MYRVYRKLEVAQPAPGLKDSTDRDVPRPVALAHKTGPESNAEILRSIVFNGGHAYYGNKNI